MAFLCVRTHEDAKRVFYDGALTSAKPQAVCFLHDPRTDELFLAVQLYSKYMAGSPMPVVFLTANGLKVANDYILNRLSDWHVPEHARDSLYRGVEGFYRPFLEKAAKLMAVAKTGKYDVINTEIPEMASASRSAHAHYRCYNPGYIIPEDVVFKDISQDRKAPRTPSVHIKSASDLHAHFTAQLLAGYKFRFGGLLEKDTGSGKKHNILLTAKPAGPYNPRAKGQNIVLAPAVMDDALLLLKPGYAGAKKLVNGSMEGKARSDIGRVARGIDQCRTVIKEARGSYRRRVAETAARPK